MGRRKRNKSSPAQSASSKKYKVSYTALPDLVTDSEVEGTDYFEPIDSETEACTPPSHQTEMVKFSPEDISELSAKLAPTLIKDLKSSL